MKNELKIELEVNKEYKHKEICQILNEPVKKGGARNKQIENWKRYFSFERPTSQKFLITGIINDDYQTNQHGGKRDGAGRKSEINLEFDYIFNCFLYKAGLKNEYYRNNSYWNETYFDNDTIYKFFGCYRNYYAGMQDENVNQNTYTLIFNKIRNISKYWIYDKIQNKENIEFGYGIIVKEKANSKNYIFRDDLLNRYNQYQDEFIESHHLGGLSGVIEFRCWNNMIKYITDRFEDYEYVKKFKKVKFNPEDLKDYDFDTYLKYRKQFNDGIVKELYNCFLKKEKDDYDPELLAMLKEMNGESGEIKPFDEEKVMQPYKYIIDNYVKL